MVGASVMGGVLVGASVTGGVLVGTSVTGELGDFVRRKVGDTEGVGVGKTGDWEGDGVGAFTGASVGDAVNGVELGAGDRKSVGDLVATFTGACVGALEY